VARVLKIVATIVAGQCALGVIVGFMCPWLGPYLMQIGDVPTLLVWSIGVMTPAALAIDATVLAAVGLYIWSGRRDPDGSDGHQSGRSGL
jgi:hypothetical protein